MNISEIKAQLESSRRIEIQSHGITFKVKMPTDYEWRVAAENVMIHGDVKHGQMFRGIMAKAIVGWEGLLASHIDGDLPDDPVFFGDDALVLLLDNRTDIVDELAAEVAAKSRERRDKRESAIKN